MDTGHNIYIVIRFSKQRFIQIGENDFNQSNGIMFTVKQLLKLTPSVITYTVQIPCTD